MESGLTPARHSRVSRILILAAALSMLVGLLAATPPTAAHSEAPPVTINPIGGTQFTPYRGTYSLSPRYTASGDVQVDSATVTVKKGKKTVARDVRTVKLAAGKYTVTQKVTYRPFSYQDRQEVIVAVGSHVPDAANSMYLDLCTLTSWTALSEVTGTWKATCVVRSGASTAELGTVGTEGTWTQGDTFITLLNDAGEGVFSSVSFEVGDDFPAAARLKATTELSRTVTDKVYGTSVTVTQTQKLTVKAGAKDCATYSDYKKVKAPKKIGRGDSVKTVARRLHSAGWRYSYEELYGHSAEVRVYQSCSTGLAVAVGFIDGRAYTKAFGYA